MSVKKTDEKLEPASVGDEGDDLYNADAGFSVVVAKRRSRKKLIIAAAVAAVLILAGVVVLWLAPGSKPTKNQTQLSDTALSSAASSKIANKDYKGAISLIKDQRKQPGLDAQLLLVSAYVGDGDYKGALAVYDSLDKAGDLSGANTLSAAQIAEEAQEYATAVRYYTTAKSRIQAEKPDTLEDLVQICDAKIAELKVEL